MGFLLLLLRSSNHKTWKTQEPHPEPEEGKQNPKLVAQKSGSAISQLFSPQEHQGLTGAVKTRFCSITSPITAVPLLLPGMSVGNVGTAGG